MKASIFFAILLVSCAATELSHNGRTVALVTAISPSELNAWQEIGPLSCFVGEDLLNMGTEEDCKSSIRNRAADLGADLVVIEGYDRSSCLSKEDRRCGSIYARAYRKKKSRDSLQPKVQPLPSLSSDLPAPTGR